MFGAGAKDPRKCRRRPFFHCS